MSANSDTKPFFEEIQLQLRVALLVHLYEINQHYDLAIVEKYIANLFFQAEGTPLENVVILAHAEQEDAQPLLHFLMAPCVDDSFLARLYFLLIAFFEQIL